MTHRKTAERATILGRLRELKAQLESHNKLIEQVIGREAPGNLATDLKLDSFELRDASKLVRADAPSFADALVSDAIELAYESGLIAEREHPEVTTHLDDVVDHAAKDVEGVLENLIEEWRPKSTPRHE